MLEGFEGFHGENAGPGTIRFIFPSGFKWV
jgi:hypothetical protein